MIQLTSILNGVESVRSQPLVATGAASDSTGSTIAQQVALSIPAESSTVCLASNPTECYDLEPIATGLSDVSALSPAPDGRLLFIEGNARVRVVTDGEIVSEPALRIDDDDARIAGIAVDRWHFRETGFVFVAWTEASSSGETQLNVTRYREVANTLGEGATILTGLAVAPDAPVSIAVDRDGLVYVALPSDVERPARATSGAIVRLTSDGRVPRTNARGLPTFAAGFSSPTSLSADPSQPRVWLAGRNPGSPYAIVVLLTSPSADLQAARVLTYVTSDEPVSLVLLQGIQHDDRPMLFVVAQGQLAKASWSDDGRLASLTALDLGGMHVTTAAANPDGPIYLATGTSIFKLLRR